MRSKLLAETAEREDVGLAECDGVGELRRRVAPGGGEARQADVDGEHMRAAIALRDVQRVAAGAAAGDEHVEPVARAGRPERGGRELLADVVVEHAQG